MEAFTSSLDFDRRLYRQDIAGSIAHAVPGAEVHAVEFSPFAHAWAAKNLAPLGVHLVLGDLRDALPELDGTVPVSDIYRGLAD